MGKGEQEEGWFCFNSINKYFFKNETQLCFSPVHQSHFLSSALQCGLQNERTVLFSTPIPFSATREWSEWVYGDKCGSKCTDLRTTTTSDLGDTIARRSLDRRRSRSAVQTLCTLDAVSSAVTLTLTQQLHECFYAFQLHCVLHMKRWIRCKLVVCCSN